MTNTTKTEIIFIENADRQSRLADLKQLLSYSFVIPIFQRPYSWDSNHFKDLLDTIDENQSEEDREAFLGSIIIAKKQEKGSDIPGKQNYLLIDGQQRITSFLILLKFTLEQIKKTLHDTSKKTEEIISDKSAPQKINEILDLKGEEKKLEDQKREIEPILVLNKIKREEGASSSEYTDEDNIIGYVNGSSDGGDIIKKMRETFDNHIEDRDTSVAIAAFSDYILNKCKFCFLAISGENSEDHAIDIFNSLNSTGEPLTAFEILKSLIHKEIETDKVTNQLNIIEKGLKDKKFKKGTQNKYTDRLILFLNMMEKDLQQEKMSSFRDKKQLLDKLLNLDKTRIKECIKELYDIHSFIIDNWEQKSNKSQLPLAQYSDVDVEAKIGFDFLRSINHDRVLPLLYLFRKNKLQKVIKLCVAFTCLWRCIEPKGGTGGIDKEYKSLIKEVSQEPKIDIDKLKDSMVEKLAYRLGKRDSNSEEINYRYKWVNQVKNSDIYNVQKLARLLLFVAFHNSSVDNQGSLNKSQHEFLTTDDWTESNYETIEHIVPKNHKPIHKIGNLILLSKNINSKVNDKNFIEKKKHYKECISRQTSDDNVPYIRILKEIVSYSGNNYLDGDHLNEGAINKRGENLGNSIWETLAEDWLGWQNSST